MIRARTLSQKQWVTIGIAYAGFIMLGLPGGLLNVAWSPYIRNTFELALDELGTLLISTTIGYFLASFFSGRLVGRFGVGALLVAGTLLGAGGLAGYVLAPGWPVMVAFGLLVGVSSGALDGGLNIYFAAVYGPRLMNWLHASFGIGATLGPLLMTGVINAGLGWRWGYAVAAAASLMLAAAFFATRDRWWVAPPASASSAPQRRVTARETLQLPAVWVGIALFLAYTGVEMTTGQWTFPLFTEARGVPPEIAGPWVSVFWGSFTIGRLLFGAFAHRIAVERVIRACLAGTIIGTLLLTWNPSNGIGLLGLAAIGFALAPVFPLLVTNTQQRMGPRHAANAIGFQIGSASLGIALLPALAGVLAQRLGLEVIGPFLLVMALLTFALYEISLRLRADDAGRAG